MGRRSRYFAMETTTAHHRLIMGLNRMPFCLELSFFLDSPKAYGAKIPSSTLGDPKAYTRTWTSIDGWSAAARRIRVFCQSSW